MLPGICVSLVMLSVTPSLENVRIGQYFGVCTTSTVPVHLKVKCLPGCQTTDL